MLTCSKCKASKANLRAEKIFTAGGAGREIMVSCRICGAIARMKNAFDNEMKRPVVFPEPVERKEVSPAPCSGGGGASDQSKRPASHSGTGSQSGDGPVGAKIPPRYRKPCSLEGCDGFYFEGKSSLELCATHAKIMRRWLSGQQTTPAPYVKDAAGEWAVNSKREEYENEKSLRLKGKGGLGLASVA